MYTEYKLCIEHKKSDFEQSVKAFMQDGWQPQGGVFIMMSIPNEEGDTNWIYFQAVVK